MFPDVVRVEHKRNPGERKESISPLLNRSHVRVKHLVFTFVILRTRFGSHSLLSPLDYSRRDQHDLNYSGVRVEGKDEEVFMGPTDNDCTEILKG